ncbi:LOW QUALITY PROTEIN: Hypothetical protein PHPALM_3264 [Phytophthora palmivora]|uniref:ATP-binding cassette (ABC) Superfamily n=1 Tax=Phytophthora palmivora TaxID=4796 RepID=A0A2P4YMX3_9STRA|nr:LOW QUALITY PROTEIN: Hypothetical protein PHPALM_3264 [Phytophthora palmivora]
MWGYIQPENTTTQSQAEALFWRWVSLKNFTVQELKELREDRPLSYILDQRDLRIEFVYLIAKRQLHSVMEGLRQQSKSSAQDERGYGSGNPGTVHRKAAKKPQTTYAPAVDPKSQQPSSSQPGAGLPAPTSSVTRGNPATSLAAGASQSARCRGCYLRGALQLSSLIAPLLLIEIVGDLLGLGNCPLLFGLIRRRVD